LELVDAIAIRVGEYTGAYIAIHKAIKYFRERIGRGREAVDRNAHRFDQHGAWPYSLVRFLSRRESWNPEELAEFLGCTAEDAEQILALFGFGYDESDGLWHRDGDEAGRLLAAALDEVVAVRDLLLSDSDRQLFESRIEELLSNGERPAEAPYGAEFEAEMAEMDREARRYDLIETIQVLIAELLRSAQPADVEAGWSEENRLEIARLFAALRARLLNPAPLEESEETRTLRQTFDRLNIDADHPFSEAAEAIITKIWESEV
jgi:hypothetical protein